MIFFTSDLHLGHAQSIEFTGRPYADVEEMNTSLIDNINAVVREKDELWILGDFAYKTNREQVREFRKQIACRNVHLVKGNHDKDYSQDHIFQSVQDYKELKTQYGKFILFHYPLLEWNAGHYGSVHLHGHIHSTGSYNVDNMNKYYHDRFPYGHSVARTDLRLRIYDVGVDANKYKPVSIEEIAQMMQLQAVKSINA